jgi:6-pyruvoyltetrahydropterin/6-carboxytetrahydropterin synthase
MNTITKEFSFDAAHMLAGHDGLCKNVHGHTYKVLVTLTGDKLLEEGSSGEGMLVDFKEMKNLLNEGIFEQLDHAFVFNQYTSCPVESRIVDVLTEADLKKYAMPGRPTAENMAERFYNLTKGIVLHLGLRPVSVTVWETPTSFATYTQGGF